jgi:hypothetical protein
MTTHFAGMPLDHPDRERMEQLCCLFTLGELSQQESIEFSEHLKACSECNVQTKEFEKLILFDLSSATVLRTEQMVPECGGFTSEAELLARIWERAKILKEHCEAPRGVIEQQLTAICAIPVWKRAIRLSLQAVSWVGWAVAAILLVAIQGKEAQPRRDEAIIAAPQSGYDSKHLAGLQQQQVLALQAERAKEFKTLKEAEARARNSEATVALISARSRDQDKKSAALAAQLDQLHADLGQRSAELEMTRKRLNEEIGTREAVQEQLADAHTRLEKENNEVSRLQELAGSTQPRLPMPAANLNANEAKEILGARDLHIVDVYDVDNGGKSSKVYGRVYYVNRNLLIFYAFDLSRAQKNRKSVAFQAWGFRQPHSTNAESLGLFYIDNASLNRWALRVSDPQVLSRIDTLFVTLEPPGGSRTPRGQRLLMASLAGPANHP